MKPLRRYLTVGSVAFGLTLLAAHAARATRIEINFNGGDADLTNNFIQNNNGNPALAVSFQPNSGIRDQNGGTELGGAVVGAGNEATAVFQGGSINALASPTTLSLLTKLSLTGNDNRVPQLGLVNMNNRSFNNELADTGFIAPRLLANGQVQLQNKTATAVNNLTTATLGTITTNTTDWFRFVVTYTPTDPNAGTYDVKTEVFNVGPDGTAAGTSVFTDTRSVTNETFNVLNAGTTAWAGMRSNSTNPTYDNFVVDGAIIPEPATLGLLGLAAMGLLARGRVPSRRAA